MCVIRKFVQTIFIDKRISDYYNVPLKNTFMTV